MNKLPAVVAARGGHFARVLAGVGGSGLTDLQGTGIVISIDSEKNDTKTL